MKTGYLTCGKGLAVGTNSVAKGFSSDFLGLKGRKMLARANPFES